MKPLVTTVGPLSSADDDGISTTATPTSGTAVTLNGDYVVAGVAILPQARRVLLTYGNEGSNRTMTITGTDRYGVVQSEVLAVPSGGAGTVYTSFDFKTVTQAMPGGGGWTADAYLGTNGVASSPWVYFDGWAMPMISIQCNGSGTVNYTVQQTLDDPNSPSNPVAMGDVTWINHPDINLVGATGDVQGNYAYMPQYARITLNSGTGSVTGTFIQSLSNT